jgi:hypothetical protein
MYDIIFISNSEPNSDDNWKILSSRFITAKRIQNIKGIHQAHIKAASAAFTKMFWAVDGDAEILDSFKFDYQISLYDQDTVHIFHSKNPVNDLEYGYGAVKLLPKILTTNIDLHSLDMTLAISSKIKVVEQISNFTKFNTDSFSAWRSAFREAVKLSYKTDEESKKRLNIWLKKGHDRPFGVDCIAGAVAGVEFYKKFPDMIYLINDFDWLKEQYTNDRLYSF